MMKKRQRSTIPIEAEQSGKPNKRQKKIILNTDNLTSPSSSSDHSAKSDEKYNSGHKHSHKHSHSSHSSYSSYSNQSSNNSENEINEQNNGEKKEKIIIQIKNTNVKKKKEKLIIQIKNDKRKKGTSTSPNSASVEGQNEPESSKKLSSPKNEKTILVLSPNEDKTEKEKSRKEKKNNEEYKNDNKDAINKKKFNETKKEISVESKKEAILKIIKNSATSENQEGKKKNTTFSLKHDKKNLESNENEEDLQSPTKKSNSIKKATEEENKEVEQNNNEEVEPEPERQKPRGRPPKLGRKKVKKESVDPEVKEVSKIEENKETNQIVSAESKDIISNAGSTSTVEKSENKILGDKEIKAEPEPEVKKHRGRPKKNKHPNVINHMNPRSHAALLQRRHEEEETTEEMILEEEISDPKGDEKVDIDGVLQNGRKYNIRTFILPHRSKTRIYMFILDAAKQIGYKDSYLFLTRYPGVKRLWTNEEDRNYLCDNGIMNNLLRNRSSGICTARNIFQQLGHHIIFNGRPIEDDYYVSNPNHNEEYHIHPDDNASGIETDDTRDDEMSFRSQTPLYMGSPFVSHYTPGAGHSHHPSLNHHHYHHKSTNITNTLSAKEYFLKNLTQSTAEYNISIQKSRKNSFYDIHTKVEQVAQRIDQVEPLLQVRKENSINSFNKKLYNLHFYSDDYSVNYHSSISEKDKEESWETVNKQDYTQYPFALMDGQYQGLYSIYPRFRSNDDIQKLEEDYISKKHTDSIVEIKPNVPEFIGNVNGDHVANPFFTQFRMSPTPSVNRGRFGHRFRSHQDSLNDTSSIASTPPVKPVIPIDDAKKKRRGKPRRVGRPRRESYENFYEDNDDENEYEENHHHKTRASINDTQMDEDVKESNQPEDVIIDVVNDEEEHVSTASPLNENVCIHCQSIDPPENLLQKSDPSIQSRNIILKCSVCHRNQHPCCCDIYDPYMISKILSYPWQCNDCKLCLKCNEAGDESKLLFCDLCDRGYHTYCLIPKLEKLPKGLWVCEQCAVCASCHVNKPNGDLNVITRRSFSQPSTDWKHAVTYINKDTSEEEVAIEIDEDGIHDNRKQIYIATFCNSCYEHFQNKRFCPLCFRCYKEHDSELNMICCDNCDRWIDVDCDPDLDDEKYQRLSEHSDAKYLCPFCDETKLKELKKKIETSNRRIVKYNGYGIIVPPFFVPRPSN